MRKSLFVLIAIIYVSGVEAFSQSYNMDNTPVTTCTGTFYDSGGSGGNYGDSQSFTKTFTPGTAGKVMQFVFSSFSIETCCDDLTIYDGPDTGSPLIGVYTTNPGTITATNPTGQLTFVWYSDYSINYSGWVAAISCVDPPPPVNDDCSGAISLSVGSSCSYTEYSNISATASGELPTPLCANFPGNDVWFKLVVPSTGRVTINSNIGDITDGGMAAYSGVCGGLSLIECDDDDSENGLMPKLELTGQTPGSTIYLRFWEYGGGTEGTFSLCAFEPPPSNDDCASAIPVTVGSNCSFTTYDNAGASNSGALPAPGCASYAGADVWFSFVVPPSGTVVIDSDVGDILDGGMAAYSGTCGSLSLIECDDDDSQNGSMAMLNLTGLSPGSTVYIRFWEYGGGTEGTFDLCVFEDIANPPSNDDCGNSITLTSGTTCSYTAGTIEDATSSGGSSCSGTANNDVWYSFVATSSFQTIEVSPSASMDAVVEILTGTCGALSSEVCINDNGSGTTELAEIAGFSVGTTYYLRIYDNGSGTPLTTTFNVCVYETAVGAPTTGDCLGAIKLCEDLYIYDFSVSGIGNFDDLANLPGGEAVCGTYEKNATWYTFTVAESGDFKFTLNSLVDYDWALFDVSGESSCADIINGDINSVRCNYSGTTGNTGMGDLGTNANEGAGGSVWSSPLFVESGQTFMLLVDNFSTSTTGYDIDFSLSIADVVDIYAPFLGGIAGSPSCGDNSITLNFNETVDVTTVSASDFSLVRGGVSYSISSVVSVNGTDFDESFQINLASPLASGGVYTLNLNSNVTDACGNVASSGNLNFTVNGVSAQLDKTDLSCFNGNDGQITAVASGGTLPYVYSWNTGGSSSILTGLSAGVYTLTVTDDNGTGCTDIVSVTIGNEVILFFDDFDPAPMAGWTHGAIAGTDTWATGNPMGGNGSSSFGGPDPTKDYSSNSDNNVYGQNLGSGTSGGYANSSNEWLSTPPIDCSNATGVHLNYWRYANFENNFDKAFIELSTDGTTWVGQSSYPQDDAWTEVDVDISTLADGQPTVYIRWRMESDGSVTYSGYNIDDVKIYSELLPITTSFSNTAANCNGSADGAVNLSLSGGTPDYSYAWSNSATTQDLSGVAGGTYTVTITDAGGCTKVSSTTVSQPAALTASIGAPTEPLCNAGTNGSATVSAGGGTPAYSYAWSSGATSSTASGLGAGTYTVTITDSHSCTATDNVVIGQPTAITSTTSANPVDCNGGSDGTATVTPSGGTPGYTYVWNNLQTGQTATGLSAGTYSVTVTDSHNCTHTTSQVVSQPAVLTITGTPTSSTCGNANGSASVSVTGGTSGYNYSWSSGGSTSSISGVSAGTYTVTVTDANTCTGSQSVVISNIAGPAASISAQTNTTCFGDANGQATASQTGGTSPYTYSWSGGAGTNANATNLVAGTYTVTVSDANLCTSAASVTITQPTAVSPSASGTNISCNGGANGTATVTASGGTPGYTYSWTGGGTTASINSLSAGTYTVTVSDTRGCTGTDNVTLVAPPVLAVTFTETNATCFGDCDGQAIANPTGGTSPYSYAWDGNAGFQSAQTATALCDGTFNVTVTDANGCTVVGAAVIGEPTEISITLVGTTDAGCGIPDGSATVSASGGAGSYSYDWSPNGYTGDGTVTYSSLPGGSYDVIVSDIDGCTNSLTVNVNETNAPSASISSSTNVTCNGLSNGSATAAGVGGTPPYSFVWAPAGYTGGTTETYAGLPAGNYTVTVEDAGGCAATTNITITQPAALSAAITGTTPVSCNGGSNGTATVSASGGTTSYSYAWSSGGSAATATGLVAGSHTVTVTDANDCTVSVVANISQPAVLSVTTTAVDVLCNGGANGSATANPAGGTSPYNYQWDAGTGSQASQTAGGLSAGTYTVTVTDGNSCSAVVSQIVGQPSDLTAAAAAVSTTAFGVCDGSATVTPANGTPAYTYQWNDPGAQTTASATGLCAGTFTVTVTDANGCTEITSATVTEPASLVANIASTTNVTCNGLCNGSATVSVNGGVTPYSYAWPSAGTDPTETGLCAGSYTVTVTDDNGYTATATATITQPSSLSGLITSQTNVTCNGLSNGSATVSASGGTSPYTYLWTNGMTSTTCSGVPAGACTVTITDANSCTATVVATITEPTALAASISNINEPLCNGGTDGSATGSATGGTAPYTYAWTGGGSAQVESGLGAGSYSLTVTDANSCTATTVAVLTEPSSLTATTVINHVDCKNGSDGAITVNPAGGTVASDYSYQWDDAGSQTTQTATGLSAGAYGVTVTDDNGCFISLSATVNEPSALSITTSSTIVSCNGGNDGTATANPSGGTVASGYTYTWSDAGSQTTQTATGLPAGTYSVTVSDDNACSIISSAVVNQPTTLSSSITAQDVKCYNTSTALASASGSGGTSPYSYLWSTGSTNSLIIDLPIGTYTVTVTDAKGCQSISSTIINQPALLTLSDTTIVSSNCGQSDGGASITVIGGTTPYTYLWSNSATTDNISGVTSGSYNVVVTDANGCIRNVNLTVPNQGAGVASIINVVHNTCFGDADGQAEVTMTGGTAPFNYNWSDSQSSNIATGLTAGTYTVTVTDDSGCQSLVSTTINENANLSTSFSSFTNISCNGLTDGTATASASGGTPPYSFMWDDMASTNTAAVTGLSAGIFYHVTITDDSTCFKVDSIMLNQPSVLNGSIISSVNVLCNGMATGSATAGSSGGTLPHTYLWDNPAASTTAAITGLLADVYYHVTVTDGKGCQDFDSVILSQPDTILIDTVIVSSTCGQATGSIEVLTTGGVYPYNYSWFGYPAESDSILSAITNGTYNLTVTDDNNCQNILSVVVPDIPGGTAYVSNLVHNQCFGDANGIITVGMTGGTGPFLYNWSDGQSNQSATGLIAGTYSVTVTDAQLCTSVIDGVQVNENSEIVVSFINTYDANCFGGADGGAEALPSGGTAPYSFEWDDQANTVLPIADDLMAGVSYNVSVTDDSLCTVVGSVSISEPSEILISFVSSNDVTCNGGSDGFAQVSVSGGTPGSPVPFAYQWDNTGASTISSVSNLSAGVYYHVTVTDAHSCTQVDSIIVAEPVPLEADTLISASLCGTSTGSIQILPSTGVAPYNFDWSPNGFSGEGTDTYSGLSSGSYSVMMTDSEGCQLMLNLVVPDADGGVPSVVEIINNRCFGDTLGSIEIEVSGGTSPYTYLWSDGQTDSIAVNLAAGNYTIEVTDANGCVGSLANIVVSQSPQLIASIDTYSDVSCYGANDGFAEVNISGGVGTYSILWDDPSASVVNTISSLSGDMMYHVSVSDDSLCIAMDSIYIQQPAELTITFVDTVDVNCFGGSDGLAQILVSGGTPGSPVPYAIQWDNNGSSTSSTVSNLTAGVMYHVSVIDGAGCTANDSVMVDQPSELIVDTTVVAASCGADNGSIQLEPQGGVAPYNFSWAFSIDSVSSGLEGIAGGNYQVTVSDANGCSQAMVITVDADAAGVASVIELVHNTCFGDSSGYITVALAGGSAPFTYTWSDGTNEATNDSLQAGLYDVTISDNNGCWDAITGIEVLQNSQLGFNSTVNSDVSCFGGNDGEAVISGFGGVIPYSYNWTGPISGSGEQLNNLLAGTYYVTMTDDSVCVYVDSVVVNEPAEIVVFVVDSMGAACFGENSGFITVLASGGTPGSPIAYLYEWSTGVSGTSITGLFADSLYSVTVTDGVMCQTQADFYLSQPATAMVVGGGAFDANCGQPDGYAFASASDGTPPYTYTWDAAAGSATTDTVYNLPSGNYAVTVSDANGCTLEEMVSINTISSFTAILSQVNISCNGLADGEASVTVDGGTYPMTYSWSTGTTDSVATGLSAGTYTVTITDFSSCSVVDSVSISEPALVSTIVYITDVQCNGQASGYVYVAATGGTGVYSYLWSEGSSNYEVFNLSAGNYSVTVTDANGCSATDIASVSEPGSAMILSTSHTDVLCYSGLDGTATVSVSGGTPPYSYLWEDGQVSTTATGLVADDEFVVSVTDANGCIAIDTVSVLQPLVISSDTVQIVDASCNLGEDGTIDITITGGMPPYSFEWSDGSTLEDITDLAAGEYYLTVTDNNDCSYDTLFTIGADDQGCLEIPDAISPNGDGQNDEWKIKNIEFYDEVVIDIFNRWGNKVYTFSGSGVEYNNDRFSGFSLSGSELPHGTYLYIVIIKHRSDSDPIEENGAVAIIR